MKTAYDIVVVGSGPGGLAAAITAKKKGLRAIILEKGKKVCQEIIDSYPFGKAVYPTIPKGETEPFMVPELKPLAEKVPVEEYISQIEEAVKEFDMSINYQEEFKDIETLENIFVVQTDKAEYHGLNVILAFGSSIPNDLGIWGEAKTVARSIENPEDYVGVPCLVLGGGNASADIVATLSRVKRDAGDVYPVYWAHKRESFKIDKDVARDLGEEILLGGHIKILQGAVPKIGEVDEEGVERLMIQTQTWLAGQVQVIQGLSFPMKLVIASVGTHGPEPIFTKLGLQQIKCTGNLCKVGKEGSQVLLLNRYLETATKGIFAIGGAISPAYMLIHEDGTIKEQKHSNLIYMAVNDAVKAVEGILKH